MKFYLIHTPDHAIADPDQAKEVIIAENEIALNNYHAAGVNFADLIGDPNVIFEEELAYELSERAILTRIPVLDDNGRQAKLKDNSLLWEYSWKQPECLVTLDKALLREVSWQLRLHEHFAHITVFEAREETHSQPEVVLDSSPTDATVT